MKESFELIHDGAKQAKLPVSHHVRIYAFFFLRAAYAYMLSSEHIVKLHMALLWASDTCPSGGALATSHCGQRKVKETKIWPTIKQGRLLLLISIILYTTWSSQ